MNDFSSIAMQSGYPLSPQQRAALADITYLNEPIVFAAALDGPWDDVRLREAFVAVVADHEILRTAFVAVEGYTGLRQNPLRHANTAWRVVQAPGVSAIDALASVRDAEQATPFEPGIGRTLSVVLVHLDATHALLVWCASRLVADARSLAMLHDALLDAYSARIGQAPASRDDDAEDEGALDYGQYVEWREDLSRSDDAPAGNAYWAAQTAHEPGVPIATTLPTRRGGRAPETNAASSSRWKRRVVTDDSLRDAVRVTASRLGIGTEGVIQAAWWVLIGRLADVSRVSGHWQNDCRRDYEALSAVIGPVDAVLPITVDVRPERSFRAIAGTLVATLDAHREVQEYGASRPESASAHGGIAFRFGDAAGGRRLADGASVALTSTPLERTSIVASFDLALDVDADADGLPIAFAMQSATGAYSAGVGVALLDQYTTLLLALADAGSLDAAIDALSIVGAAERARLLAWQGETLDVGTRSIPDIIRDFAATQAAVPAIVSSDLSLDYATLEHRVAAAAQQLVALGASPERPVGIALPRSGGLVVALLAAMRTGAAYLPLDPEWPEARRQQVVEQAQPAVVIVADTANTAARHGAPTTVGIAELLAAPTTEGVVPACPLDGAAYLLFTSGSTGTPKGVLIGQRQLLNYARAVTAALRLDSARRFALTSTVAADLGNTTLFGALVQGGTIVVATADEMRDGEAFARFVREQEIDCVKIVPSHLDALLDVCEPALPAIVVLGGEAASDVMLERIRRIAPETRIVNHYGPTETTVGVAVHEFSPARADGGHYASGLPLTTPLANCRLRVLDAAHGLVPTGKVGELYIGGAQLCDGYWGGAHSDAFVDDPFLPGARLYRSGDLARVEPEGGIRIVGRVDDQVKVRGFRIELGDVEAALRRLADVRQAAVRVVRRGSEHDLVAYVVSSGEAATAAGLKAALREQVPDAMVPSRIVLLSALPRLPNGKIDRQALPDGTADDNTEPSRSPSTSLEKLLAHTAATLLERETIGLDDDFFALGGHSLLVIRFVTRVQDLLHVELLPGTVFAHPTIESLASALRANEVESGKLEKVSALRLTLSGMTPEAREALLAKARQMR